MKQQILIVDDEAPIRRLLERIFSGEYKVFCTADAFEALEIVQSQKISLIISDHRMPQMSGIQMFEKIMMTHPQIPRVLLSGYVERDHLEHALEKELIHKFVSKPWNVNELKKIVADVLEIQRQNVAGNSAAAL